MKRCRKNNAPGLISRVWRWAVDIVFILNSILKNTFESCNGSGTTRRACFPAVRGEIPWTDAHRGRPDDHWTNDGGGDGGLTGARAFDANLTRVLVLRSGLNDDDDDELLLTSPSVRSAIRVTGRRGRPACATRHLLQTSESSRNACIYWTKKKIIYEKRFSGNDVRTPCTLY